MQKIEKASMPSALSRGAVVVPSPDTSPGTARRCLRMLLVLLALIPLGAQETVNSSGAEKTIPYKLKAAEPGRCDIGEMYQNTTTGKLRRCIAVNTWAEVLTADAAGNLVVGTTVSVAGRLSASIWDRKGTVFAAPSGEPSVIYEATSRLGLGAGSVFKSWYDGCGGTCYAESLTAIPGTWTIQGVPALTAYQRTSVKHVGSTYYFFGTLTAGGGAQIDVLTSTDGTSFTLLTAGIIAKGGAGTWDAFGISTSFVDFDGATWRVYYSGIANGTTGVWQEGMASGTTLQALTKYVGNPVITTAIGPGGMSAGGVSYFKDGTGALWLWSQSATQGTLPTDIYRYTSSDWVTWTRNPTSPVLRRLTVSEGAGSPQGQIADPCLVEANGKTYIFYSTVQDQTLGPFQVQLAVASMTLAQLVATDEGAANGYLSPVTGNYHNTMVFGVGATPVDSGFAVLTPGLNAGSGNILLGTFPYLVAPTTPITTGVNNISLGLGALTKITTGSQNVAIGSTALISNLVGTGNIAIGNGALGANTTSQLTGIGNGVLANSIDSVNSSGFGAGAGATNTHGYYLTLIGALADVANNSLHNSSALGYQASVTRNNQVVLGGPAVVEVLLGGKCSIYIGSGSPNSAQVGSPCDLYLNTAGGAAATFWAKESGAATNTGWVGK